MILYHWYSSFWKWTTGINHGPKVARYHLNPGWNASIVQCVLHIWQGYLTFSYYFIFDRIVCVSVTFYLWGHFVMLIIRNLNLISIQSWICLQDLTVRGRNLTTSLLLRKSQNLLFWLLKVQWASKFTVFVWFMFPLNVYIFGMSCDHNRKRLKTQTEWIIFEI